MKTGKVIPILVICLAIVLALTGCAAQPNPAGQADKGATTDAADGVSKAGVVWGSYNDNFQAGFRTIMEEEAAKMGGIELNMQDGEFDSVIQLNKISTLITAGYKLMAIDPIDIPSTDAMLDLCVKADIPVIFFATQPSDEAMASYDKVWYVGAPASDSGTMCAQVLCDYWKAHSEADKNGDGKLQLAILQGVIGHNDVKLRTDAYYATLESNGIDYEVVKIDTANWDKVEAQDKMTAWITELGAKGIEGVLCNSDGMAIGALNACLQNNFNQPGSEEFIPICGIDATIEALNAMKTGGLLGTCLNDRVGASVAILNMLKAIDKGIEITPEVIGVEGVVVEGRHVWVPYKPVSADNVDEMLSTYYGK